MLYNGYLVSTLIDIPAILFVTDLVHGKLKISHGWARFIYCLMVSGYCQQKNSRYPCFFRNSTRFFYSNRKISTIGESREVWVVGGMGRYQNYLPMTLLAFIATFTVISYNIKTNFYWKRMASVISAEFINKHIFANRKVTVLCIWLVAVFLCISWNIRKSVLPWKCVITKVNITVMKHNLALLKVGNLSSFLYVV